MLVHTARAPSTSARCLQRRLPPLVRLSKRLHATATPLADAATKPRIEQEEERNEEKKKEEKETKEEKKKKEKKEQEEKKEAKERREEPAPPPPPPTEASNEQGAFSRRLEDLTERGLEDAGARSAQTAVADAGFSPELRRRLEARLLGGRSQSDHPQAFATVTMPSTAGKGTRDTAAAQPWQGMEKLEDTALRMLDDAHKPLRGGAVRMPQARVSSLSVDTRMKQAAQKSQGHRLAHARDQTSIYALAHDTNTSDQEREQMRAQLKARFAPDARPMPTSIRGLAALANERIEAAIARGQFQNLPRGKGRHVERDHNASSPFLDTTEYLLNKIIQRQEIVPPWIEKQQELGKAAAVFRSRLRNDWRRHAARMIASRGGSLDEQVRRAEAYAAAEARLSSRRPSTDSPDETAQDNNGSSSSSPCSSSSSSTTLPRPASPSSSPSHARPSPPPPSPSALVPPFRDPAWEQLEHAYHTAALDSLNTLTRSYNLVAPALAQKPYFRLPRELHACFADVAPLLPGEIRARARLPQQGEDDEDETVEAGQRRRRRRGGGGGSGWEWFGGEKVPVWEDRRKPYGLRELWRDWFAR